MQPRKEAIQQGQNPESQVNLPKETYQMIISPDEYFSEQKTVAKHDNQSSLSCLEQFTYQITLKLVTQYLYTLNLKQPETFCNPITFNTPANTC